MIPKSLGGSNTWDNVVASCGRCNLAKGNAEPKGIWQPQYKPYHPTYWQVLANRKKFSIELDHESWADFFQDWSHVTIKELAFI